MRPCLTLIAGPNGSGKTTLTLRLAETVDLGPVINPDDSILRYYRTMLNLFEGVRMADTLHAFDNSAADATPKPVFTKAAASLSEAQPEAAQPAWARDFLEQCQRFGWDLKAAKRDYAGRTRRIDGGRPDPEQDPGVPSS